jgi:hypothetical protein
VDDLYIGDWVSYGELVLFLKSYSIVERGRDEEKKVVVSCLETEEEEDNVFQVCLFWKFRLF